MGILTSPHGKTTARRGVATDSDLELDEIKLSDSASQEESLEGSIAIRPMKRQTCVSIASADGQASSVLLVDWDATSRSIDSLGYQTLKRLIDIVGALVGLVVLSPVMIVAMILVWLEDGRPVMFRQTRVGWHGQCFHLFKIRTMVKDAEARLEEVAALNRHEDQRTFKADNDPRVLKIGWFLRRSSIDEFPQLINVLLGQMSLVGPRPPLPHEVHRYDAHDYVRLAVKPGLTCFWQVSGRGTIPFKRQVELDRKYIHEASTWVDIKLILKTIPALLKGIGAN